MDGVDERHDPSAPTGHLPNFVGEEKRVALVRLYLRGRFATLGR